MNDVVWEYDQDQGRVMTRELSDLEQRARDLERAEQMREYKEMRQEEKRIGQFIGCMACASNYRRFPEGAHILIEGHDGQAHRVRNALCRENLRPFDVQYMTDDELLNIRNLGVTGLAMVRAAIPSRLLPPPPDLRR